MFFTLRKFDALFELKKTSEAKATAERMLPEAIKGGDESTLWGLSMALRSGASGDKELMALALKAAHEVVAVLGEHDHSALLNLATTYHAAGNKAKANEFADKAVAAAAKMSPAVQRQVEQEAKKLKDDGK